MLAVQNHGELQFVLLSHGDKADNARGGLFTTADDIGNFFGVLVMDKVHKVAAVVDDDVGARFYHL